MNYTLDQLEAVNRILGCSKNYYEMLEIPKEATENDVKKAYKRLALQLHPDKNKAPRATEAFKAVGAAAALLCDEKSRAEYDYFLSQPSPDEEGLYELTQKFVNSTEADWAMMGIAAGLGVVGGFLLYKGLFSKKRSDQ